MITKTATTATAGFEWPTSYRVFENHAEIAEKLSESGIVNVVNAAQKQAATQGAKSEVLKAVTAAYEALGIETPSKESPLSDEDKARVSEVPEVAAAVSKYNEAVEAYVITGQAGRTREKGIGSKKTQKKAMDALYDKLGSEGLEALLAESGITVDELQAEDS